jgi:hypothetical protein
VRRAAAAVVLLAALLLAAGCGGETGNVRALPPGSFVSAGGSFSEPIHLFGDTLTAETDVVVDRRHLDPDRVSVKTFFAPYEQVGDTQVTRHDADGLTGLRYRMRLRCLERSCITATLGSVINPGGSAPRIFRFQPVQVRYTDPGAKQSRLLRRVRFPVLESVTRIQGLDSSQVYGFPFRATLTPLPALTYRVSPTTLGAILLVVAVALLVLPAALLVRWYRRRRPPPEEPEPEITPLERAVGLVVWSRDRAEGAERREALEALATALDDLDGTNGLSSDTRALAWSAPPPSAQGIDDILAGVEEWHG